MSFPGDDDELVGEDIEAFMDQASHDEVVGGYQDFEMISNRRDVPVVDGDPQGLPQISDVVRPSIVHDELEDHVIARDKAGIGPNGERLDEIYQLARLRQQNRLITDPAATALLNPPSAFAGSGANLANQVTLTPQNSGIPSAVQQNVVYWQGTNEEVGPVTITLQLLDVQIASILGGATGTFQSGAYTGLQAPIRPFAVIHWGAFGQLFQAEIDIGRGVQFTLNCSSIAIDLGLDDYPSALVVTKAPSAVVQAALAFKNIGRPNFLIRTRYGESDSGVISASNSKNIYVPGFAVALLPVQMSQSNASGGKVQLDFKDATDTIKYTLTYANGVQTNPIPITTDISQVLVTNAGNQAGSFRLPFQLAF